MAEVDIRMAEFDIYKRRLHQKNMYFWPVPAFFK